MSSPCPATAAAAATAPAKHTHTACRWYDIGHGCYKHFVSGQVRLLVCHRVDHVDVKGSRSLSFFLSFVNGLTCNCGHMAVLQARNLASKDANGLLAFDLCKL